MAKRKKREVVEMMLQGADRTALVTGRMKKLYERGRGREKERQSEAASPESDAADTVQEEMKRVPQEGVRAVRQLSRIPERVRRVKEIREREGRNNEENAVSDPQVETEEAGEFAKEISRLPRQPEYPAGGGQAEYRRDSGYARTGRTGIGRQTGKAGGAGRTGQPMTGLVSRDRENTRHVPSARAAGTSKPLPAGEQMRASVLKQAQQTARKASATGGKATAGSAGKAAAKTTKRAAARAKEAAVNSAKAVYHGIKSSAALIAAGGGIAVLVILLVCMVGMIFGSAFGIFFAGTQSGGNSQRTLQTVIRELDAEYDQMISGIQGSVEYDAVELHGARPEWKEVLAVYAVKTNLDPNDSDELITMTTKKEKRLRDVFWDMVSVSSNVVTEKRTVTTSVTDESGNVTEKTEEKEVVVLTIRTTRRFAGEMAVEYGFDLEQEELLRELLDRQNDPLWVGVIY